MKKAGSQGFVFTFVGNTIQTETKNIRTLQQQPLIGISALTEMLTHDNIKC